MIDAGIAATAAQFGLAGLVCCMWIVERRSAQERERQATEIHERMMLERKGMGVLVRALNDNTRALAMLETGQRSLVSAIQAWLSGRAGEAS